jgi:hypothetical protein
MSQESPRQKYDFFISRAGADADVAREVADALRHAGHTVRYQDEDIPVGANFIERMSALVEDCNHLLIILSPAYLSSPYCREEWTNFLSGIFSDQEGRRVVVLLAQDCKPPGILRARVYGSLVDKSDPADRRTTIVSAAEGRASRIRIDPPIFEVVPPRNPTFFGRDDVIAKLDAALIASAGDLSANIPPIAILGPPGVGKSSIAAEYAYRHAGDYWGVWWLPAQSRDVLIASLSDLAVRIDPKLSPNASKSALDTTDLRPVAKAGLGRLRGGPMPWLLIYDNVENPHSVADLLPPKGVHVLMTTRWSDWHGVANELNVDLFSAEISQNCLLQRADSKDKVGAARLASALGFLPLALDQAGAVCKRTGLSFDDFRKRLTELIRMKPAGSSYPESVFGTFSIAIDSAAAICPDAERLMGLLSLLAPDNIPLSYIGPDAMDLMKRTAALESLTAVSLVTVKDGHLRVHRLVQEVMRQRLQEMHASESISRVVCKMLKEAFIDVTTEAEPWEVDKQRELIYENVLWTLYHDPSPRGELELSHKYSDELDIEVTFSKTMDGILRVFRVMDCGRPFHRIETLYYLGAGWESRQLSNRQF